MYKCLSVEFFCKWIACVIDKNQLVPDDSDLPSLFSRHSSDDNSTTMPDLIIPGSQIMDDDSSTDSSIPALVPRRNLDDDDFSVSSSGSTVSSVEGGRKAYFSMPDPDTIVQETISEANSEQFVHSSLGDYFVPASEWPKYCEQRANQEAVKIIQSFINSNSGQSKSKKGESMQENTANLTSSEFFRIAEEALDHGNNDFAESWDKDHC